MSYEGEGLDLWGVAVCWRCGILFNTELDELGRPMRNECQECEDWANGEDIWGCEE